MSSADSSVSAHSSLSACSNQQEGKTSKHYWEGLITLCYPTASGTRAVNLPESKFLPLKLMDLI